MRRSPQRSVITPAVAVNDAEPNISAVNANPSCAFESANVATRIGESEPNACCITDAPACAVVISARTRQRGVIASSFPSSPLHERDTERDRDQSAEIVHADRLAQQQRREREPEHRREKVVRADARGL